MAKMNRIGKHATHVSSIGRNGAVNVRYHDTDVVRVFEDGSILLDTGGYFTATTKVRMNQASNQFGLGFHVYQRNRAWFVDYAGQTIPFVGLAVTLTPAIPPSGLTLERLTGAGSPEPELGEA